MSVNIFGLAGNKSKSFVTKKDLDSKFIILTKNLQSKINKTGDTLSGNLGLSGHKITDLADPISDTDASNKTFVKSEILSTKLYINTMLNTKLDKNITENLNMNGRKIVNLENPINNDNACNKQYVDSKIRDENILTKLYADDNLFAVGAENLFDIGVVTRNFLKEKDISLEHFSQCFGYVEKIQDKYANIFIDDSELVPDILQSCMLFKNLKVLVIRLVEDLPENTFKELKIELMKKNLLSTPEGGTLRKRYRRFIGGLSKIVDPSRENAVLELLIQKNFLLIDLGYVYYMDSLLKKLLDEA